jgi:hypothetical protein
VDAETPKVTVSPDGRWAEFSHTTPAGGWWTIHVAREVADRGLGCSIFTSEFAEWVEGRVAEWVSKAKIDGDDTVGGEMWLRSSDVYD